MQGAAYFLNLRELTSANGGSHCHGLKRKKSDALNLRTCPGLQCRAGVSAFESDKPVTQLPQ
jgi:hypothetical protein